MLPELAPNMFQSEEASAALRRTVAQHLVRSGSLETAEIFARVRGQVVPPINSSLTTRFCAGIGRISAHRPCRVF